ncbi:cytochrome b/b6 domain-containing protein [Povalibacter sp.]|uniref:cytochrome b/b6 domain-containing protein n=1 Tax=Povalibacter sp. TaxID=1962978 RepID=UPI002F3F1B56
MTEVVSSASHPGLTSPAPQETHPAWLRITHWVNAVAVALMVTSGWQIYNASPLFAGVHFPTQITLGGWLGGALLWHFAAMWLLVVNFLVYLALGVLSGRLVHMLLPVSARGFGRDLAAALRGALVHDDPSRYNMVQKAAYIVVILTIMVLIASGLAIWKPVQFSMLCDLMGGYDTARVVHFFAMTVLVGFFAIHVTMALLVPRSLLSMVRGR